MNQTEALTPVDRAGRIALKRAIELWAKATTDGETLNTPRLIKKKCRVADAFFSRLASPDPLIVTSTDVADYRRWLEEEGCSEATVYNYVSCLSSFYAWAMKDPALGRLIKANPVTYARPKAPKPYDSSEIKPLDDEEIIRLFDVVAEKAASGSVVAKRDYALLCFYTLTGMRREEIGSLRGDRLTFKENSLLIRTRVKGGKHETVEIADPLVREKLLDYLESSGRMSVLGTGQPLWTRHDRAGSPGNRLHSSNIAKNFKGYAARAGIKRFHLHRIRHTFARITEEETGSLEKTREALGHKNIATTRVYVQSLSVRRDRHSALISARLKLSKV